MTFWDYVARMTEMARRVRPLYVGQDRRYGWFDVPSWVFDQALTQASYGRTSQDGEQAVLVGYPVRVDARMAPDALRYVTPAGGPH